MSGLDELYYMLGRLECLQVKNNVKVDELNFVSNILEKNHFFREIDDIHEFESRDFVDYDDSKPIMMGDPRCDQYENPWIDVFGEGDEAEAAYWNTE